MHTEIPEAVREFLTRPQPAVMATVAKDGRPVSVPTWYLLEPDGAVLLNFAATRVRLAHVRRDPRVSLTVMDSANWYTHVTLQLAVESITDDPDLVDIDALSTHYSGDPYDDREGARVSARATIVSWHGWGSFAR